MTNHDILQILHWHCSLSTGEISNGAESKTLEPKTIELLFFLARNHSTVLHKDQILEAVWGSTVVSDDVLAKTISKLRKALNDNPKDPTFIETLPKRGYRFLVVPTDIDSEPDAIPTSKPSTENSKTLGRTHWAVIIIALLSLSFGLYYFLPFSKNTVTEQNVSLSPKLQNLKQQADDYYFQYTRSDNESAIKLYERIIAAEPEFGPAQSGLATALVQKVLRWPNELGTPDIDHSSLTQAHEENRLNNSQAKLYLARAQALAERAARLSPKNYSVHRSLGLVYAAQKNYAKAEAHYDEAIRLNPKAWGAMINKAELADLRGDDKQYLALMQRAYKAMGDVYQQQVAKVRPWYPRIGVAIAERYRQLDKPQDAEIWYRTVLNYSPLDKEANLGLMQLMKSNGQQESYAEICQRIKLSVDPEIDCNDSSHQ